MAAHSAMAAVGQLTGDTVAGDELWGFDGFVRTGDACELACVPSFRLYSREYTAACGCDSQMLETQINSSSPPPLR